MSIQNKGYTAVVAVGVVAVAAVAVAVVAVAVITTQVFKRMRVICGQGSADKIFYGIRFTEEAMDLNGSFLSPLRPLILDPCGRPNKNIFPIHFF